MEVHVMVLIAFKAYFTR